MHQKLLLAICSLMTWTTVFAAEDSTPISDPQITATEVAHDAGETRGKKKQLRYLLGMGYTAGGDKLATATYTDGSSDSISAGSGLILYGGMDYRVKDTVSIQGSLGYHFDSTKAAQNGEVMFRRIPLEFLVSYQVRNAIRVGGGARMVFSPKVKGSGIASSLNDSFSNTVGLVIEAEYLVTPRFGIKVRHVSEKYKLKNSTVSLDGSHFGLLTSFYF